MRKAAQVSQCHIIAQYTQRTTILTSFFVVFRPQLAREVLEIAASKVAPGVKTDEIDKVVFEEAIKRDCYPSPLGYHGYPKSVCTSVNEVICHGIPDQRPLEDGDIINIGACRLVLGGKCCVTQALTFLPPPPPDVTLYHRGFHGDLNGTYTVGPKAEGDEASVRLIKTARDCLDAAIGICGPGVPYAEIGKVIQPLAEANGCAVAKNWHGHGISRVFHSAPTIFHHKTKKVCMRGNGERWTQNKQPLTRPCPFWPSTVLDAIRTGIRDNAARTHLHH